MGARSRRPRRIPATQIGPARQDSNPSARLVRNTRSTAAQSPRKGCSTMSSMSWQRLRRSGISVLALLAVLAVPAGATAATETFHRFEVEGTANYIVNQDCGDGTTAQTRVTVIGGHEEESESGETTLDSDFLTVLLRGFDCEGNLVNDRGSGPADFTFSPSLQEAAVIGTITTREGRSVTVDTSWAGT